MAELYRHESAVEAEVCRAAALEVIAHEAQQGRSALSEAFSAEQAEIGRIMGETRMTTAIQILDIMHQGVTEEIARRTADMQAEHNKHMSEVNFEKREMEKRSEATHLELLRLAAAEENVARQASVRAVALTAEMQKMEAQRAQERNTLDIELHAAGQELNGVKVELRAAGQELSGAKAEMNHALQN